MSAVFNSHSISGSDVLVLDDDTDKDWFVNKIIGDLPPSAADNPTFILDIGEVVNCYKLFQELLPNVEIFYAVKANSLPPVLSILSSIGSKFDCASKGEIVSVLEAGADPADIFYANPNKYESHLKFAEEVGVNMLVVDSCMEIEKIKRCHKNAQLILRITGSSNGRFGARPDECRDIFQMAKDFGLAIAGISFHVGSFIFKKCTFIESIAMAKEIKDLGEQYDMDISIIDVGGGFPSPEGAGRETLEELTEAIDGAFKKYFSEEELAGMRLLAEPGLAIAKSCGTEVFKIINKQVRPVDAETDRIDADNGLTTNYVINDSMHGGMLDVKLVDPITQVPRPLSAKSRQRPLRLSTVYGYSCSPIDVLFERVLFPDVDCGEYLYVGARGSYGLSCVSGFNGFGEVNIRYCIKEAMSQYLPMTNGHTDKTRE